MKQADLNRAVAAVTGETVHTICRLGFSLCEPDADHDSHTIDQETAETVPAGSGQEERRYEPVRL